MPARRSVVLRKSTGNRPRESGGIETAQTAKQVHPIRKRIRDHQHRGNRIRVVTDAQFGAIAVRRETLAEFRKERQGNRDQRVGIQRGTDHSVYGRGHRSHHQIGKRHVLEMPRNDQQQLQRLAGRVR